MIGMVHELRSRLRPRLPIVLFEAFVGWSNLTMIDEGPYNANGYARKRLDFSTTCRMGFQLRH